MSLMRKGGLSLLLGFAPSSLKAQEVGLEEHCFKIDRDVSIAIRNTTVTPEEFLRQNPEVLAAINGVYFGKDEQPEGFVFLAENHHLATERPQHTRGYFTIDREGSAVQVTEELERQLKDYWLIIGTHPLLIQNGHSHSQSKESRYSQIVSQRTAIGTKDGRNICFAVSKRDMNMGDWAKELENRGYRGAINLDGGPYSQLATRNGVVYPKNNRNPTRQVVFSYRRKGK